MNTTDIFNIKTDTVSITHVGRVRKANEDTIGYTPSPNGHIFVVCDGMGGHVGGKEASQTAVDAIVEFFTKRLTPNVPNGIKEAIIYANKKVYEKAQNNPGLKGMGTTVTVVVIKEDKVYIGHAGDSRIYLFSDNKLYHLTKDHSYVQELFDHGIIDNKKMQTHSRKNEITKALGLRSNVEPEVPQKPLLLKNGDTILMCSDGLSDMVNDKQIEEILLTSPNVKEAGNILLNTALNHGGRDNISLQMIKITNSNYKNTIFVDKTNKEDEPASDITLIDENPQQKFDQQPRVASKERKLNKKTLIIIAVLTAVLLALIAWFTLGNKEKEEKEAKTNTTEIKQKKKNYNIKICTLPNQNKKIDEIKKSVKNEIKNKTNDIKDKAKEVVDKILNAVKTKLEVKNTGNNKKLCFFTNLSEKDVKEYYDILKEVYNGAEIYIKENGKQIKYIINNKGTLIKVENNSEPENLSPNNENGVLSTNRAKE